MRHFFKGIGLHLYFRSAIWTYHFYYTAIHFVKQLGCYARFDWSKTLWFIAPVNIIYIYIYTCNRVANAVKTVLNTLLSVEL